MILAETGTGILELATAYYFPWNLLLTVLGVAVKIFLSMAIPINIIVEFETFDTFVP